MPPLASRSRKSTTTRWRRLRQATRLILCRWPRSRFRILERLPRNRSGRPGTEAATQLGLRGVEIPPKVLERRLDESDFEVFWEAAEALRMVVCIHPFEAAPTGALTRYFLGNLVANLYDTGLAAALLIYGGVLERHPKLRIVLYHAGGVLPVVIGRFDMGYRLLPECRSAIPRPPSSYLSRFSFDIIAPNREMLRHLVKNYGPERFVIGSDYPLPAGLAHPIQEVKALGLDAGNEAKILRLNAQTLLSR
jgi:aminocarboxymuconate-semialdehyde decarboxylase